MDPLPRHALTKTKSQKARARAKSQNVPRAMIAGSGAYNMQSIKSALKPILREALANGGAALGGLSGIPGGSVFGRDLAKALTSRIIGSGDYQTNVSVNELIKPPGGLASASFGEDATTIRLRRREFLADVLAPSTPGTFTNYSYPINAGMRSSFPFLSQLAANYEEYCFDGLVFEFISSASPYVTASSLGTVIASMAYNASSPPFTNKYTMENSAAAISTRIDKNLMYGVECAKGSNPQNCYYVRSGASTLPLTTTDLGNFQLAVAPATTVPANAVLGELWVTYDVILHRPVLSNDRFGYFHNVRTGVNNTTVLGNSSVSGPYNRGAMNMKVTTGVNTSLSFSDAVVGDIYQIDLYWISTTNLASAPVVPGFNAAGSSGCQVVNTYVGTPVAGLTLDNQSFAVGGYTITGTYVAGARSVYISFTVQATSTSGIIDFSGAGYNLPTGSVWCEIRATMIGNRLDASDF